MKKLLLLTAVVVAFTACKKEIKTLPDETQIGANTFGAKLNGENWGPLKAGILPTAPLLEARFSGDQSIVITARNFSRTPIETEMEIFLKGATAPGTYLLNQTTARYPSQTASYGYYEKRNINVEDQWITGSEATGEVVITRLDIPARIVSGTFQFTANAKYGSAPITVTEGRFDLTIQ